MPTYSICRRASYALYLYGIPTDLPHTLCLVVACTTFYFSSQCLLVSLQSCPCVHWSSMQYSFPTCPCTCWGKLVVVCLSLDHLLYILASSQMPVLSSYHLVSRLFLVSLPIFTCRLWISACFTRIQTISPWWTVRLRCLFFLIHSFKLPYNGNLSRVKTFANFCGLGAIRVKFNQENFHWVRRCHYRWACHCLFPQFAKVLIAKIRLSAILESLHPRKISAIR